MKPELLAHVKKFGALIAEAESIRKHMSLHYGLNNAQIAALVQGRRGTLDTFAESALRASRRLGGRKLR